MQHLSPSPFALFNFFLIFVGTFKGQQQPDKHQQQGKQFISSTTQLQMISKCCIILLHYCTTPRKTPIDGSLIAAC
jgi:hypothetical protein